VTSRVSAPVVAKERMCGDEIVRARRRYESLITVAVITERQERSGVGTAI